MQANTWKHMKHTARKKAQKHTFSAHDTHILLRICPCVPESFYACTYMFVNIIHTFCGLKVAFLVMCKTESVLRLPRSHTGRLLSRHRTVVKKELSYTGGRSIHPPQFDFANLKTSQCFQMKRRKREERRGKREERREKREYR